VLGPEGSGDKTGNVISNNISKRMTYLN